MNTTAIAAATALVDAQAALAAAESALNEFEDTPVLPKDMADVKAQRKALKDAVRRAQSRVHGAKENIKRVDQQAELAAEHLYEGASDAVSDKVYALAWDHGHSAGFSEVANYYADFAQIANAVAKDLR